MEADAIAGWTVDQMGRWGRRAASPACAYAAEGSDLDGPPLIAGSGHHTARLAWRALGTAGEHAGQAYYMLVASGGLVPTKPFLTAARTTMLGAARALYVLEPSARAEREVRSLQLLRKEAKDLHNLVTDWEKFGAPIDEATAEARTEADQFSKDCQAELVARGKPPGSTIDETELLTRVSPHLDGATSGDPLLSIMSIWRLGSGTAHARTWAWDTDLEDQPPEIRMAYMWSVPMGLMNHAWSLWCERRGDATDIVESAG